MRVKLTVKFFCYIYRALIGKMLVFIYMSTKERKNKITVASSAVLKCKFSGVMPHFLAQLGFQWRKVCFCLNLSVPSDLETRFCLKILNVKLWLYICLKFAAKLLLFDHFGSCCNSLRYTMSGSFAEKKLVESLFVNY